MKDEEVVLMGWIHEMRDLGGIIFVLLRDRDGVTQITAPSKKISPELFEELRKLKKESVIAVKGRIQESGKAPGGVEIIPAELKLLSESKLPLPLDTTEKVRAEIDTRLDSRFIDLRKHSVSAIFKIKSRMLHSVRVFLESEDYNEINTPKLVGSATEGGTELFPITYFEREAFLRSESTALQADDDGFWLRQGLRNSTNIPGRGTRHNAPPERSYINRC